MSLSREGEGSLRSETAGSSSERTLADGPILPGYSSKPLGLVNRSVAIASPAPLRAIAKCFLDAIMGHVGIGRVIKREELRLTVEKFAHFDRVLEGDKSLSDAEFRRAKEELIEAFLPICSGQKGYHYGANQDETDAAAAVYDRIAKDATHKAECLRRAGRRLYSPIVPIMGKQMRLEK